MKRVLIISPYFPPSNAADMHRVRMSLPYFEQFGWQAEVVCVNDYFSDTTKDPLLAESIPTNLIVHKVGALPKKITSKLGLGSIALRSLWNYKRKVNQLFKTNSYDLIYFSTTQFPVCLLGAYWKRKFRTPYVIDFQDPWFSTYYDDKPKNERPRKYWFSYRLNKYLEPIAVKNADGLISVSEKYIDDLKFRYPTIVGIPTAVIIFGTSEIDRQIAIDNQHLFPKLFDKRHKNLVYVGRGGYDMHKAIKPLFEALKQFFNAYPHYAHIFRIYFIGTSYAPKGTGKPTIKPLALLYNLDKTVVEITDRMGYYEVLAALSNADALFVPGSDDPAYIASKLLPLLFARKPLLAVFNSHSSAIGILDKFGIKHTYRFDKDEEIVKSIKNFLIEIAQDQFQASEYPEEIAQAYSAKTLTQKQTALFDQVIKRKDNSLN